MKRAGKVCGDSQDLKSPGTCSTLVIRLSIRVTDFGTQLLPKIEGKRFFWPSPLSSREKFEFKDWSLFMARGGFKGKVVRQTKYHTRSKEKNMRIKGWVKCFLTDCFSFHLWFLIILQLIS